jgi:hypothetical protein
LFDALPLEWLLTLVGLAGALAAPFGASALQSIVEQRSRRRTMALVTRAFRASLTSTSTSTSDGGAGAGDRDRVCDQNERK